MGDGIADRKIFFGRTRRATWISCACTRQEWVQQVEDGDTLTPSDVMKLEVPFSRELVEAFWLAAGGTILAAQSALRDGFGCNIGGGFHHAHPRHGEGFCAIHDVAVAIRRLQARQGDSKGDGRRYGRASRKWYGGDFCERRFRLYAFDPSGE